MPSSSDTADDPSEDVDAHAPSRDEVPFSELLDDGVTEPIQVEAPSLLLGFGPAPIDYSYGARAHRLIRNVIAGLIGIVHLVLALLWDWPLGYVLSGFTVLEILLLIPYSSKLARPLPIFWIDTIVIALGLILLDAPLAVPGWGFLLLVFVVPFLGGRSGVFAVVGLGALMAGVVAVTTFWDPWVPLSDDRQLQYAYVVYATTLAFTALLVMATGVATRARSEEIQRRREAEHRLHRRMSLQQRRMQAISEHSSVGLALQDANGAFLATNKRALEMYGTTEKFVREHGFAPLNAPHELDAIESAIRQAQETGESASVLHEARHAETGAPLWIELSYVPLIDEDDVLIGGITTIIDRTEEVQARRMSEVVAAAADAAHAFLGVWRPSGEALFLNQTLLDFFGIEGGWKGRDMTETGLAATSEEAADQLMAALQSSNAAEGELHLPRYDGVEVPFSVALTTGTDALGEQFHVGIARDISEQKQAAERLEELLRSKDEFVASVSHELRTPLTAVVGLAREMADRISEMSTAEISDFSNLIAEQSTDVSAIVEDLLTTARLEAGTLVLRMERTELGDCADRALQSVSAVLRRRTEFDRGAEQWVFGDQGRVRQIIRNLLTNADRYGGADIGIVVTSEGDFCRIEVRDSGPPIDPDLQAQIFEPYGRAHGVEGVTDSVGLGLAVSRGLAEQMGGDVTYEHDGTWSIFSLSLPRLPSDSRPGSSGSVTTSI